MKTVLCASDLSPRSDRALARAARLASEHAARLVVVKVVDEELPDPVAAAQGEAARAHLAEALEAGDADGAAAAAAEIRIETGDPSDVVARLAEELDVDLLVLGPHRARPLEEAHAGGTLERIVRAVLRPCLLVAQEPAGPYARVLCGVDLSPAAAAAIRAAGRVAPDAALTAFHAVHIPRLGFFGHVGGPNDPFVKEARAELRRWAEAEALEPRTPEIRIVEGSVHHAYDRLLHEIAPDLLAVGAHGRATLSPTLLGGFARRMIHEPPCDVLIVRR